MPYSGLFVNYSIAIALAEGEITQEDLNMGYMSDIDLALRTQGFTPKTPFYRLVASYLDGDTLNDTQVLAVKNFLRPWLPADPLPADPVDRVLAESDMSGWGLTREQAEVIAACIMGNWETASIQKLAQFLGYLPSAVEIKVLEEVE
jgi:hypothetical protein